jgi:phospholipid/cholesterol/gamma-HCH transport system substrate-binding protein
MVKINSGEGTLGMLIQDTTLATDLGITVVNLKESSEGLNENMEALKHNFLFRRYYKRKAKKEEQLRIDTKIKNAVAGKKIVN